VEPSRRKRVATGRKMRQPRKRLNQAETATGGNPRNGSAAHGKEEVDARRVIETPADGPLSN